MESEKTGVFSMDLVHQILALNSVEEAKKLAKESLKSCSEKVRKANVAKAHSMIERAKTVENIAFGMSNFILAFQDEKVIK